MTDSILRPKAAAERVGLSKNQIRLMEMRGEFPAKVRISERAVGYSERAIQKWIEEKISASSS